VHVVAELLQLFRLLALGLHDAEHPVQDADLLALRLLLLGLQLLVELTLLPRELLDPGLLGLVLSAAGRRLPLLLRLSRGGPIARIVAFAKGAGMIEPNMATMLCYVLTDADLPCGPQELQEMLRRVAAASFNAVSVDGDESTSDTVALLCSRRAKCEDMAAFEEALLEVCRDLAQQLVHNGEGTEHVMRVSVSGASSDASALRVGRAVANGPLFKCAVAGNDPNVGRLVGKVGQQLGAMGERSAVEGAVFKIAGQTIFADGQFSIDEKQEAELSQHFKDAQMDSELSYPPHFRVVDVEVQLGAADGSAVMLGSDLTTGYVNCNADYRS